MKRKQNVYFIQRGTRGLIKIGTTSGDPVFRMKSLQYGCSEKLRLLGCIRGIEKEIHLKFRQHRVSGEWFKPHAEILQFVRENATTPLASRNQEHTVAIRLESEMSKMIESERRRMSEVLGINLSVSAVVRALLVQILQKNNPKLFRKAAA